MEKITKKLKSVKKEMIIISIAMVILGTLMVLFPNTSAIVICRLIGIMVCVWGIFRVVSYFRSIKIEVLSSFGLAQGIILIAIGIYFMLNPGALAVYLVFALSIVIFINALLKLQYSIDLIILKIPGGWLELFSAGLMIILGAIIWAYPFAAAQSMMLFAGFALIFGGIWDIVTINYISKKVETMKSTIKENVERIVEDDKEVDATYTVDNEK